ncbi:Zinc/iron permease [Absidia repens]|uniref:Zinc/iron permease n=1 Tax=Absidia repens TaxID=90262 RepID=A0A1X2IHZ9_9FUNG|nr:Zinc/iron permease [Absidia repens]
MYLQYPRIIYILSIILILVLSANAQEVAEQDACSAESLDDYNMGLRVGSIFIILITSALGTFTPMIIHRIRPYSEGSLQDWILTIGKFFGTGVLLATAFVHLLPEAMDNFSSPCLAEGWKTYGAFAGVFCMISSFALQLLELAAVSNVDRLLAQKQDCADEINVDCEADNSNHECSNNTINHAVTITTGRPPLGNTASMGSSATTAQFVYEKNDQRQQEGQNHHHGHVHSAGFLDNENAFKDINTIILELGIVMHSIIIGITLANTQMTEFTTLLIALIFHQFFEGIALGTRVNEVCRGSWVRPFIMGMLYIVMTPIGISIGIGIHSSFNPNSSSSVLSSAILDSLSAGILLYNAYVSLMSLEINHSQEFRKSSASRKCVCFLSMYIGAGIMALIGLWA